MEDNLYNKVKVCGKPYKVQQNDIIFEQRPTSHIAISEFEIGWNVESNNNT